MAASYAARSSSRARGWSGSRSGMPRWSSRSSSIKRSTSSGPPSRRSSARTRSSRVPPRWSRPQLPSATITGSVWMPASVSEYATRCPRPASTLVSNPAATRCFKRLLRMFEAMPSSEPCSSSRKCRRLPNITSRSTRIVHGSPSASTAALIAHPDLGACVTVVPPRESDCNLASLYLPYRTDSRVQAVEYHQSGSGHVHHPSTQLLDLARRVRHRRRDRLRCPPRPCRRAPARVDVRHPLLASMFGEADGSGGADDAFAQQHGPGIGAEIMGRGKFGPRFGPWEHVGTDEEWRGWWGDNPPFHTPVFVLTHHPRPPIEMEGGTTFHFATDGILATLERAQAAARGKDVRLGGGVSTIRQYLQARLVDELHIAISPILLGAGEHLLGGINTPALGFEC